MVLKKLLGKSKGDDRIYGSIIWSVSYDVDDYTGPGWYVSSIRIDNKGPEAPGAGNTVGPFDSQDEAVGFALSNGKRGDVVKIWDKDRERDEPDLRYVRSDPE